MLVWIFAVLCIHVSKCQHGQTPHYLMHQDKIDNLAQFGDAQHRGPMWYSHTENSDETMTSLDTEESTEITSSSSFESASVHISGGSSQDTSEGTIANRIYRACTPCPHDMLKKYTNLGIKWICGGYQRARRTFKSDCMMRYRNCQDGTMFIKLHDNRCRRDAYHGKSFFYQYKV